MKGGGKEGLRMAFFGNERVGVEECCWCTDTTTVNGGDWKEVWKVLKLLCHLFDRAKKPRVGFYIKFHR